MGVIASAHTISSDGFLPERISVGGVDIGPADWLRAALAVLDGETEVRICTSSEPSFRIEQEEVAKTTIKTNIKLIFFTSTPPFLMLLYQKSSLMSICPYEVAGSSP